MKKIKELDEEKLKKKKIKSNVKKTVLGIVAGGLLFSLIPNIKYRIALIKAKNDEEIVNFINDKENRQDNLKTIYEMAINSNNNISDDKKDLLIEAFEKQFLEPYYYVFSDDMAYNMYAVASTQKVKEMSNFTKEHGWWSGDYNSYINTIYLYGYGSQTLLAHEQLHGILKNGLFDTGYTKGLSGYGLNEALTVSFVKDDSSYFDEYLLSDYLGLIIGYDKLYSYYFNGDLDGLKDELNKYLTKEETNKLVNDLDILVFSGYGLTFISENNLEEKFNIVDSEKISKKSEESFDEIRIIMRKLFEEKFNCKPEDSNLGRIIFGKGNDVFDDNWKSNEPVYDIYYFDDTRVKIVVQKFNLSFLLDSEQKNYVEYYLVNIDELDTFDIDAALELANEATKHY